MHRHLLKPGAVFTPVETGDVRRAKQFFY